jgi:hypothetical protein
LGKWKAAYEQKEKREEKQETSGWRVGGGKHFAIIHITIFFAKRSGTSSRQTTITSKL